MRPGARVQAAIDLVAAIEQAQVDGRDAADALIQHYFRTRRYAGSKDRRAVIEMVYGVLRDRGMLTWRLGGDGAATARLKVFASLDQPLDQTVFDGEHAPEAPTSEEVQALGQSQNQNVDSAPDWARFNVSEWLIAKLEGRFGDRLEAEMAGLSGRAPLDLRVNLLRGSVEEAQAAYPDALPATWAAQGLRFDQPRPLQNDPAYQNGLVEIQDEGSQIAALLCGAKPGMQVLDLCAGAGGKSLALAAQMENSGQIYAYDIDHKRLSSLRSRAKRADARNIQSFKTLEGLSEKFDRVVLDVPCSGSGTWRRSPDLRWRLMPDRLKDLTETQAALLRQGAGFVKSGGQLIYIVCSILRDEAEDQVDTFLSDHAEFSLKPYVSNWPEAGPVPPTLAQSDEMLLMTPASHGTDGFFVAVLERAE